MEKRCLARLITWISAGSIPAPATILLPRYRAIGIPTGIRWKRISSLFYFIKNSGYETEARPGDHEVEISRFSTSNFNRKIIITMAKRALIVGINTYPSAPLRGCVNDALMISEMLTQYFGFQSIDKRMLTDDSATTDNIRERLNWLVDGAVPGDVLFFSYSGHGSQMVDTDYDAMKEPDGLDEIICPVDLNWRDKVIKDDELKAIFDRVPEGISLTVLLDCCHSGSGMDHMNQWQPETYMRSLEPRDPNIRALPMPIDILNRGLGLDIGVKPRSVQSRDVNKVGLMIAGCQSNQTSADAYINYMYCGAATYSMLNSLKKHNYDVTYRDLLTEMNQFMTTNKYSQRPELNGSEAYFDMPFLSSMTIEENPTPEPVPETPTKPTHGHKPPKKNSGKKFWTFLNDYFHRK